MREAVNTTKITAWKLSGRTTCTNSLSPGSTDFLQHGAMLATPLTSSLWLPAVLQSPWHTYTVGLQLPLYEPSTGFNIFQMTDLRFWLHVCLVFKICVIYAQLCIMCRFAYVCIVCTHTHVRSYKSVWKWLCIWEKCNWECHNITNGFSYCWLLWQIARWKGSTKSWRSSACWVYVCFCLFFQLTQKCFMLFSRLDALGSLPFILMQSPHDLHLLLNY